MKKHIITAFIGLCLCLTASAQNYRDSRYYNPQSDRLDYGQKPKTYDVNGRTYSSRYSLFRGTRDTYIGVRLGPAFAKVYSDDSQYDGGSIRTGVYAGVAIGTRLTDNYPLYIESGLYFTQKGGKGNYQGEKFNCELDYLELPLLFKYRHPVNQHIKIEPYFGAYFALGVGGKVRFSGSDIEPYSSFSSEKAGRLTFKRCDAGLKLGVGASYDLFYLEFSYDWGLANIAHDNFDKSHTGSFILDLGVNF